MFAALFQSETPSLPYDLRCTIFTAKENDSETNIKNVVQRAEPVLSSVARYRLRNRTQRSTAIRVRVMPSLVTTGRITTPPRLTLPTVGQANFYISNSSDLRFGRLERAFTFSQDGVVRDERSLVMRLCVSDQALERMRSYEDKKITAPSRSLEP
jgi:hypothetical protein